MEDYKMAITSAEVVLVEFYADWCPHCQKMMPIVAQVKELLEGIVPVYQYEIERDTDAAAAAEIKSIPTFLLYRGGMPVWHHTGELGGQELLQAVQKYAGDAMVG